MKGDIVKATTNNQQRTPKMNTQCTAGDTIFVVNNSKGDWLGNFATKKYAQVIVNQVIGSYIVPTCAAQFTDAGCTC